jgi:hypothetical protein
MERVKLRSASGIAKVVGVALCLAGVFTIAGVALCLVNRPVREPYQPPSCLRLSRPSAETCCSSEGVWIKWTLLMVVNDAA